MLKLSLVVPDATVNYIENPNCRYDTTGYNAAGATLTRVLDFAKYSIASCKVVTNGSVLREGVYYRVNSLSGISDPITVSVYVIGTGMVRVRLINNPTGREWFSQPTTLRADRWTRLTATGFSTGSNDMRLYVETDEGAAKARTFYVGGLQMERKAYATTFVDGDQPGCRWNGIYHRSTSQRSGETRAGGRWVVIGGPEREEQDLYMTVVGGLGMAGMQNNTQSYALDAGSYFQNKKITDRTIVLTFHAKHKVDSREDTISLAALHQLRQLLLDVVKPDRTGGDEEILFEYDDGELPLYFMARYDGGLEGDWDIRNQWVNSFPLRLLAVSPLLFEDQQVTQQLVFQEAIGMNYAAARINGVWNNLNYGFNEIVSDFGLGSRGEVYAMSGNYSVVNNNAAALNPLLTTRGPVYWEGEKWTSPFPPVSSNGVYGTIAISGDGKIYVGGAFSTIGGVAASRIAYWNGNTWVAMGTGLNGVCRIIAVAPNGDVYAGGEFTTAGGVSSNRIARWDGYQWRRVGQYGGLNADVETIVITPDGKFLYAGGGFTDQNGLAANALLRVTKYNMSTGMFSAVGNGFNNSVNQLALSKSNILYAVGEFTLSGSDTIKGVAQFIGNTWLPLGTGVDSTSGIGAYSLAIDSQENIFMMGNYLLTDGRNIPYFSRWNGSSWTNLDIKLIVPVASTFRPRIIINPKNDDIFIKAKVAIADGLTRCAGITQITNSGTTELRPTIYALGPGTLRWIENQTTQKRLYLDLTLLNGEEVFFDFGKGTIRSTIRGDLFYALLPGSDFRSFTLAPGVNRLACFMVDDVNAKMSIQFTPQHWSADATQNVEAL